MFNHYRVINCATTAILNVALKNMGILDEYKKQDPKIVDRSSEKLGKENNSKSKCNNANNKAIFWTNQNSWNYNEILCNLLVLNKI